MGIEISIAIRTYSTFVELERKGMLCSIRVIAPHKAELTTREYQKESGWKQTGYEEIFEGKDNHVFNMAYQAATRKLIGTDRETEDEVVKHLAEVEVSL